MNVNIEEKEIFIEEEEEAKSFLNAAKTTW